MSVKSTVTLTRKEAEDRYMQLKEEEMQRKLKADVALFNNKSLEDYLEYLNDKLNNGEGFENYIIKEE